MTALTIGFFDGVHLGHQTLLRVLRSKSAHTTILTFSNRPQEVLTGKSTPLLIPLSEKIALLKEYGDEVIVTPFTLAFAATPYDKLLDRFKLTHIVLGKGDAFGYKREGNEKNVTDYAQKHHIIAEYIPKVCIDGLPVSSTRIREAIATGNTPLAEKLLGRKITQKGSLS